LLGLIRMETRMGTVGSNACSRQWNNYGHQTSLMHREARLLWPPPSNSSLKLSLGPPPQKTRLRLSNGPTQSYRVEIPPSQKEVLEFPLRMFMIAGPLPRRGNGGKWERWGAGKVDNGVSWPGGVGVCTDVLLAWRRQDLVRPNGD